MNQAKKKTFLPAILWAGVGAAVLGAAGCGSSGGAGNSVTMPASVTSVNNNTATTPITRADEPTLSDDAKILATRQATGALVSLDDARAFDADLAKIRAAYPAVRLVHAQPSFAPKTLLVITPRSCPWFFKWLASGGVPETTADTDLSTGEASLDALLAKYHATRTTDSVDLRTGNQSFTLLFAQSLNMKPVADEFARSSPNIVTSTVAAPVDVGQNLVFTPVVTSGGPKVYVFSENYPTGSISGAGHYTHTYALYPDGSISESVNGTPPPTIFIGGGGLEP